jgi:hypothetical protein
LLGFCFLTLGVIDARLGIMGLLAYSFFNGDIRRLVNSIYGWPAIDPLLLQIPIVVSIFGLSVLLREKVDTPIARLVLVLMAFMGLEIFNPLQGGLRVGLVGAFFYIPPLMFFWVGRRYVTPAFIERLLYQLVLPIAMAAAVAGYLQQFIGFAPWEQAWINHVSASYMALNVGGYVRPFGFSTSSAGYVTLLSIGAAIALAGYWLGHRRAILGLIPLLPALVLSSERAAIVKFLVAGLAVWALQRGGRKGWYLRIFLAGFAMVGLLAIVLPHLMPSYSASGRTGALLAHEVGGLANPLNSKDSTLMLHLRMLGEGILSGFTHPYGYGLGATTAAASRFSGNGISTETDFGNMFASLGFVGGIVYIVIVVRVLWALVSDWQRRRQRASLMILGILLVTLASWLIAGQYSIPLLLWLLIGATDAMMREGKKHEIAGG